MEQNFLNDIYSTIKIIFYRGKTFREDYLKVPSLRVILPNCPVMALTATTTQEMVKDILKTLHISECEMDFVAIVPDRYIFHQFI